MKHFFLTTLIAFFLVSTINAQTVDSIKVEQAGDKILIHYQILQSNELQVFRISLSCFLSTGIKLEPKSISGDFGENVVGGKPDYMIVWDVLKDLEELQSAEFSVSAELIKGHPSNVIRKRTAKDKFHVQMLYETPPGLIGLRIGYTGAWGISLMYCAGKDKNMDVPRYVDHQSIDLTKRLANKDNLQLHLFGGFSSAQLRIHGVSEDLRSFFGPDAGLLMNIRRISMSVQVAHFGDNAAVTTGNKIEHFKLVCGLGVRF